MLCHENKCIYIHIPKSAGQSIHTVFARRLGFFRNKNAPLLVHFNNDPKLGPRALAHLKAADYVRRGHISQELFDAYFKFTFVRNPWARIVSEYKFRGHARNFDFKTFLFKHLPEPNWSDEYDHIIPQYDYLHDDNGKLLVDFVGKFERLQKDFDEVCRRIGLPPITLPHRNKSLAFFEIPRCFDEAKGRLKNFMSPNTKKHTYPHYTDYYDSESREFVAELYRKDIEAFGYKFEPHVKRQPNQDEQKVKSCSVDSCAGN